MTPNTENLAIPTGLTRKGRNAAHKILNVLRKHNMMDTGGCKLFRSPKEWSERGEKYGTESLLVVIHDGGYPSEFFGEFGPTSFNEEMVEALKAVGCYPERCTGWYTAIYED